MSEKQASGEFMFALKGLRAKRKFYAHARARSHIAARSKHTVLSIAHIFALPSNSTAACSLAAVRLCNTLKKEPFKIAQFDSRTLNIFRRQSVHLGLPSAKYLFPNAIISHKFFANTHWVAI